jgi:hypothetical protein
VKKFHILIMILCCLIPIVALVAIYLFKVPMNSVLLFGVILICPISHLVMVKLMRADHTHNVVDPSTSKNSHE